MKKDDRGNGVTGWDVCTYKFGIHHVHIYTIFLSTGIN